MKRSKFLPLQRLPFGFTAIAFLTSVFSPIGAVVAGSDDPKELQSKTLTKNLQQAGISPEDLEKLLLKTVDFWLQQGNYFFAKKSYSDALKCYEQAASYGSEEAKWNLEEVKQATESKQDSLNTKEKKPFK
jgi:tetratricopeptide (TPR) repeat protein